MWLAGFVDDVLYLGEKKIIFVIYRGWGNSGRVASWGEEG